MIWEGMVQEGLAVTRAVHDRYHPSRRNPWNEVECGDHYARSMASYGVFLAACGYEYHGPKRHLAFAPRLSPENFRAAFTTAEGWGTFSQKDDAGPPQGRDCRPLGQAGIEDAGFIAGRRHQADPGRCDLGGQAGGSPVDLGRRSHDDRIWQGSHDRRRAGISSRVELTYSGVQGTSSVIHAAHHLERGYERLDLDLAGLGARIERLPSRKVSESGVSLS